MQIIHGREVFDSIFEIVNPRHTAVLCIDMQKDLTLPDGFFGKRGVDTNATQTVAGPLSAFLDKAREHGVRVVCVQQVNPADGSGNSPAWLHLKAKAYKLVAGSYEDYMVPGTEGCEFIEGLEPKEGDLLVQKFHASAFMDTGLNLMLRSLGIKTVVVTGAVSNGCVITSVLDATCCDYYTVVVKDLVVGPNPVLHDAAMKIMQARADCADSAEILDAWAKYNGGAG